MSTMVEILQRIVDTRGAGFWLPLCWSLDTADDYDRVALADLWADWEHYSGDPVYPIPDPDGEVSAERIFDLALDRSPYAGPYGELRLKLAAYLLEALQAV